jgi:hypothetical protein
MTGQAAGVALALVIWAALLGRLPALWRERRDAARRVHCVIILAMALVATLRLAPVTRAFDGAVGVPNVARLAEWGCALVATWGAHAYLLLVDQPEPVARRRARRHAGRLLAAFAGMSVLFALARADQETADFWGRYGAAPFVFEARLVYFACMVAGLAGIGRLCWRYARLGREPALRLGLRVSAAGAFLGLGVIAFEALHGAVARFGGAVRPLPPAVQDGIVAVPMALLVLGSTMPSWGPRVGVSALCRWVSRYRAYLGLYPLWRELVRAAPEIVLLPPAPRLRDALAVRDLRFRLHRRVVEIWDGRLALAPYVEPQVASFATARSGSAGLTGRAAAAAVEAAVLAAAVRAKRRATPPAEGPPTRDGVPVAAGVGRAHGAAGGRAAVTAPGTPEPVGGAPGADIDRDAAFLVEVARGFRRSPVVRDALAYAATAPPRPGGRRSVASRDRPEAGA